MEEPLSVVSCQWSVVGGDGAICELVAGADGDLGRTGKNWFGLCCELFGVKVCRRKVRPSRSRQHPILTGWHACSASSISTNWRG
jgi:hypothetical protein